MGICCVSPATRVSHVTKTGTQLHTCVCSCTICPPTVPSKEWTRVTGGVASCYVQAVLGRLPMEALCLSTCAFIPRPSHRFKGSLPSIFSPSPAFGGKLVLGSNFKTLKYFHVFQTKHLRENKGRSEAFLAGISLLRKNEKAHK